MRKGRVQKAPFLLEFRLRREEVEDFSRYPFALPAIRDLETLEFHPRVTFFVGENGSGKSTLMEAIAVALGINPEGGSKHFNFSTRDSHSHLGNYLTPRRGSSREEDGYFLRAESYYNVASNIDMLDEDPRDGPRIIDSYGGVSLHNQSHGESFLALAIHRLKRNGIFLMDEPEAALSPLRQLGMLKIFHELVTNRNSQLIIATHSPILMAYPDAWIYDLSSGKPTLIDYESTEHYNLTRDFLNNYRKYLDEINSST